MIPRFDGLVPVMRAPERDPNPPARTAELRSTATTATAAAAASSTSGAQSAHAPQPTLRRFTLFTADQLATGSDSATALSTDADTRLYSFIASRDCAEAPSSAHALMASSYTTYTVHGPRRRVEASNDGGAAAAARHGDPFLDGDTAGALAARGTDGEDEESEPDVGDDVEEGSDVVDARERAGAPVPVRRKRIRTAGRRAEPARLLYSLPGAARAEADGAPHTGLRLRSVPLPEYEALACVVLEPCSCPTAATLTAESGADGDNVPRAGSSAVPAPPAEVSATPPATVLRARRLARPIMELRCERTSALATTTGAVDGGGGGVDDRHGISSAWGTVSAAKAIKKGEWKSMDDLDAAEAAASRREAEADALADEPRGADEDGDRDDAGLRKARKRVKEMTKAEAAAAARAAQAALMENRQRLYEQHQQAVALAPTALPGLSMPTAHPLVARAAPGSSPSSVAASGYAYLRTLVSAGPPSSSPSTTSVTPADTSAPLLQSPSAPSSSLPALGQGSARGPRSRHGSRPSDVPAQPTPPHPVAAPSLPIATIDSCGRGAIAHLRDGEGRHHASLPELEKLILKRLPSYESVALKMRDPTRKAEAVAWFKRMQQELKLWLLQFGCTIDPTGLVCFPARS